ncbi:MAG TPA: hypothetical protein VJH70_03025 [Candidatus Paceibacterota bacterium]
MNQRSKIDMVDGFIMLAMAGIADGTEFLMNYVAAIPVIGLGGPLIASLISFLVSAILLAWFIIKGIPLGYLLSGSAVDMMPLVNMLPAKTAAVIATILKDRGAANIKTTSPETKEEKPKQEEELKEAV